VRPHPARTAIAAGALTLCVLLAPGVSAAAAVPPAPPPALTLAPCELEHPLRLTVLAAECGVLSVVENPRDPAGRHIALHVARIAAISRRKQPDPLFVLAGGPGMAASAFYATVAPAFARILRERDIVLVDQRGSGASNRLDCPADEDALAGATDAAIAASTRACLAALAPRASPAYYTTSLAVEDLERVRAALGYARINLYGASYGTRVAQHYLRRFPQRTRSVILDGVVPATLALGAATAFDAERALRDILARCAAVPACRGAFGDPAQDYQRVRAALGSGAVAVELVDPASGAPRRLEFSAEHFATVLRLTTYTSEYAALLPLLLHAAGTRADYAPLAAQFLLLEHDVARSIAVGMHNSVVCAEDLPFLDLHAVDRVQLAATYLGGAQLQALAVVCALWPRGPVDADLHAPLESDVPALLLSGSDDPVTPPQYARVAAAGLHRSLALVLSGFGHGQLAAPCIDAVMAQFLARAAVASLDVSCTRAARPLPFFTSVNGPPP
jgi:pimeloyl-ACP methyl ester carboxylesterase